MSDYLQKMFGFDNHAAVKAKHFLQIVRHESRRYAAQTVLLNFSLANPIGVERALLIDSLVRVRAEVVALSLQQVCRQAVAAIPIVIGEGSRKRGNWNS